MNPIIITLIALLTIGFLSEQNIKIKREKRLIKREMDSMALVLDSLQHHNAKIERALKCKDYAVCTALKRNIQYNPAIVASWMQYLGLSRFGYEHVPDSLLKRNCPCDSLKNDFLANLPE